MLLHLLVLAPFVSALLMLASSGFDSKSTARLAIFFGILISALSVLSIVLGPQSTEAIEWFRLPGTSVPIFYSLASHGINSWLVFISSFVSLVALIAAKDSFGLHYKNFSMGIFALMGAMNGSFLATDAVLFFFFFEAMVLPAALLIAAYGGADRKRAAMDFAIYTLVGSAPMLLALWYMLSLSSGASVIELALVAQNLPSSTKTLLGFSFMLAFLVKTPLFPFHGWQAKAYAEAPSPLSAVLAGAMSKVGVFGFIYWLLPVFDLSASIQNKVLFLSLFTALYGALVAMRESDAKKLLAFSSMSHLGLVVAVVFTGSTTMLSTVLILMVAHALSSSALFVLTGVAERFSGSRKLQEMGGYASKNGVFGFLFVFAGVASLAVPGTIGFVGELMALISFWEFWPTLVLVVGLCMIFSVVYTLRFVQAVVFGPLKKSKTPCQRLSVSDALAVGSLLLLIILWGLQPNWISKSLQNPVEITTQNSLQELESEEAVLAEPIQVEVSQDAF
jgi:NADH-quinone oxidoreductase subunit M